MGWFSGQSKAAKELERKRQQERDEENAKKADDVCEEQKTPYQKKVEISASRRVEAPSLPWMDSWPSHDAGGAFFVDVEAILTHRSTSRRTSCASLL